MASPEPLEVRSPHDGGLVDTIERADADAIEDALATAHARFRDRSGWLPVHERAAVLERAADALATDHESLSLQAAREGGKPLIDSRVELTRAIDGVRLAAETIRAEAGEVVPVQATAAGADRIAFTQREPIGPVVAVSAFNHPMNLIVHQVAAAVAAGCPVIVKPANDTPLSCRAFVERLHGAGLPEDGCRCVVPVGRDLSERLVTDPRVAFLSFIGSADVGWMLRSKLAPGTRCALEHGGVAPLIVAEDADVPGAVEAVAKGGFYHAGQVCVSVQRVFAHASVARDFADALAARAATLVVGDPTDPDSEVGPLIRQREVERVHEWVREAIDGGATSLSGAERVGERAYAPTVLFEPPPDSRVSREEIFGPVVSVYAYEDIDVAIERANALPYAFQAAVFTRDIERALHVFRRVDASAVMVNDHTAFRVDGMPFAGLRRSGLGVGGIPHTIRDMQVDKMLVLR